MQQLDLAGFDRTDSTPRYRLFFALWPEAAVRAGIDAVARRLDAGFDSGGRRIQPHRYHLTLQFLGEHPEDCRRVVDAACRAAERIRIPAFDLVLDRAGSFPIRSAPCWLGCAVMPDGLRALWDGLGLALARESIRTLSGKQLTPHVTVVRDAARRWPDTALPLPVAWRVAAFSLLQSDMRQQFAYTELGRWTLRD
ncbi:RNA 2',3'-cyclic phosphodiesterase [Marilutibacter alkalisoli]|uniref:RNA 2',3'-cyclic phosphodiesterase n=1 Tax=Marilutibacter alkalisoli TaxID=2591633 RepID=A0A514BSD2_9GAMM|nr:RNA 2',3'-cyclic phosphodiesterase [Lysobacter alkalisoli]QDH70235.1 RNA 2',3'-cyclic phosphodiesterase [Lysobacter alkalisoli]